MNKIVVLDNNNIKNFQLQLNDLSTLEEMQNRIDEAENNNLPAFHSFTDVEMIKWFLYERKYVNIKNERTEETIEEYKRELVMFVKQIIENHLNIGINFSNIIEASLFKSLQGQHLRKYQDWLATKSDYVKRNGQYSPATLERKTTIIKSFFTYLYEADYIKEPIYKGLRIATVRKDDRPNRDLGPADVVSLLSSFEKANHQIMFTIIHVLTTTGLRNEEFCNLKVKDFKRDSITGSFYLDVLGKGNKRRHIPLKEKVVESIHSYRKARGLKGIEEANSEDPLFTTNTGKPFSPSYFSQYVKSQIIKFHSSNLTDSSIKITPHVFRHAFAIISKLNDVDVYDIMRSLGHEKIETTMIYLEKVFEKERHAIHAWDSKLLGEYI